MRRFENAFFLTICMGMVCFTVQAAFAQGGSALFPTTNSANAYSPFQTRVQGSVGIRKYVNSFTSYQFPSPDSAVLDPLSRLEWPWEQTYGVVKLAVISGGLEIACDVAASMSSATGQDAQDSDWEDPENSHQKTTFSDALSRPRGWMFNASLSYGFPGFPCLRGVAGTRGQQFRFTYTNILQRQIFDDKEGYGDYPADFTPGASIEFSQAFRHYYAGGILVAGVDLASLFDRFSGYHVIVKLQGDYGIVTGNNEDYHILRTPGPRFTLENTRGTSWHLNATAELQVTGRVNIGLEGDFMRIHTTGNHQLFEPAVNESWGGGVVGAEVCCAVRHPRVLARPDGARVSTGPSDVVSEANRIGRGALSPMVVNQDRRIDAVRTPLRAHRHPTKP
jgi:hypothetical protein